ncbi:MAG TPA: hypothetical protein VJ063_17885 [Verrucomicrobiae bacterium]|nr:hypothetical protein [Verrucomicrobiae bacterium]
MAKSIILFLAIVAGGCTTVSDKRDLPRAEVVKAPSVDDELIRALIEDRRTWIDPDNTF